MFRCLNFKVRPWTDAVAERHEQLSQNRNGIGFSLRLNCSNDVTCQTVKSLCRN